MNKLAFLAVLMIFGYECLAQTGVVKGKITDAKTKEPLPSANIFINNTTLGISSELNGGFQINRVPLGPQEIVVSFIGYQTYKTKISISEKPLELNITLVPQEQVLNTVEVKSSRDKVWDKQLRKFEKEFLGSNRFARECTIANPWVINFTEKNNSLIAAADSPLEIFNMALGYKIIYHLIEFEVSYKTNRFAGNVQFIQLKPKDPRQMNAWRRNREQVYQGSLCHLFRSIIENKSGSEGYELFTEIPGHENTRTSNIFSQELGLSVRPYETQDIVSPGPRTDQYNILMKGRVEVHYKRAVPDLIIYKDAIYPITWIEVRGNYVTVDRTGRTLNPENVVLSGAMNNYRVANMLPLNYQYELNSLNETSTTREVLKEKVYIQTDKGYYHQGEIIRLKGYLHYSEPVIIDSMSSILHIELISSNKAVASHQLLKIENGTAVSELLIPESLPKGIYCLRAYTDWMKNFVPVEYFIKSIPILKYNEELDTAAFTTLKRDSLLQIQSSQETYLKGDTAILTLHYTDQLPLAQFSLSVVNRLQAARPAGYTIKDAYPFQQSLTQRIKMKYAVENGIPISGRVFTTRGKAVITTVIISQKDLPDPIMITTDEKGEFKVNNLEFYDSLEFNLIAAAKGSIIKLIKSAPFDTDFKFPDFTGHIIQTLKKHLSSPKINIKAQEIVPVEKKEQKRSTSAYGIPDYTMLPKDLIGANLMIALQGKIPGLSIYPAVDGTYSIRVLTGTNATSATQEPMVMLNGTVLSSSGDAGSASSALMNINLQSVARVELVLHGATSSSRLTNGIIHVFITPGMDEGGNRSTVSGMKVKLAGFQRPPSNTIFQQAGDESDGTIYWNPVIKTEGNGTAVITFVLPQQSGEYLVTVEGVSANGKLISAEIIIKVK